MYNRLAEFYDWEHRDFRDDLQLYLGFASATGGPVLEAACGTGRVLVPLAEAGYSVTGVDNSEEMLSLARPKVEGGPLEKRVRLVRADLRSMSLGQSYRLALVALSSFHHLTTLEDQRSALRRLADHLVPGGLLIVDLINPNPDWLSGGTGSVVLQMSAPYPGPEGPDTMMKFVASTTYFDIQEDRSQLIYDRMTPDGRLTRQTAQITMRFLFRYEAELLLAESGFRVRNLYGDYEMGEYRSASPRMIFVAEKR